MSFKGFYTNTKYKGIFAGFPSVIVNSKSNIGRVEPFAWLDAGDTVNSVTKDGSNSVSSWRDKNGGAVNFEQSTPGYYPTWVDAVLNGYPVIQFDGAFDVLRELTAFYFSSVIIVANYTGDSTFLNLSSILDSNTPPAEIIRANSIGGTTFKNDASGIFYCNKYINGIKTNDFSPLSDYKIIEGRQRSGLNYINDAILGRTGTDSAKCWAGNIAEILFFNKILSDEQHVFWAKYLADKYAIPLTI